MFFFLFQICKNVNIANYVELLIHTTTIHSENDEFECILGNCMRLTSLTTLKNHLFLTHNDVIQYVYLYDLIIVLKYILIFVFLYYSKI